MGVEYREIEGWPGYRVGSDGSVWSRRFIGYRGGLGEEWRLMKQTLNSYGYPTVGLKQPGKRRLAKVHTLVAGAFLGPKPYAIAHCRHLDGDKLNNSPDNLAWGTPQENSDDARRLDERPIGSRHHFAKLDEAQVAEARRMRAEGLMYREIAERFGVSKEAILKAIRGERWQHVEEPAVELPRYQTRQGCGNRAAKLTVEQVIEIRSTIGETLALSRRFGVSKGCIKNVRRRRSYSNIP